MLNKIFPLVPGVDCSDLSSQPRKYPEVDACFQSSEQGLYFAGEGGRWRYEQYSSRAWASLGRRGCER